APDRVGRGAGEQRHPSAAVPQAGGPRRVHADVVALDHVFVPGPGPAVDLNAVRGVAGDHVRPRRARAVDLVEVARDVDADLVRPGDRARGGGGDLAPLEGIARPGQADARGEPVDAERLDRDADAGVDFQADDATCARA